MKILLQMIVMATLAFGLIACDHVVLPGGGNGGGSGDPADTTGGDDSTGGSRDTNKVLEINGPIVNAKGERVLAPEGAVIFVVWETGRDADVVYGQGEVSADRKSYRVRIAGLLPGVALFDPNNTGGVHGVGHVMLARDRIQNLGRIARVPNDTRFQGQVLDADVIFNTGLEKATPWSSPWIDNFNVGYSMGITAFVGWVPVERDAYPLTMITR